MRIKDKLLNYFANKTHADIRNIDENQNLLESGLLDSLQLIEFVVWLENETQKPVDLEQLINEDKITLKSAEAYLATCGAV
jgi:acyl carrier protein